MTVLILLLVGGGLIGCVACFTGIGVWAYAVNKKAAPIAKADKVKANDIKIVDGKKEPDKVEFKKDANPPQQKFPPGGINVVFGANGMFRHDSQLTVFDPANPEGLRHKLYSVRMEANRTYQIDMKSNQIDAFLIVVDDTGADVARDDDSGGGLNARIIFTPARAGVFQIEACHCPQGINPQAPTTGNFTITIQRR
jgi:hypothetical protein